jgi:hypothetical protein
MKIEYAEATGCSLGQFVVSAENKQENAILRAFLSGHSCNGGDWKFHLHGWGGENGRTDSFNFGWAKDLPTNE